MRHLLLMTLVMSAFVGWASGQTLADFETSFDKVRKLVDNGQWKSAEKKLGALMREHEGQPHAYGRKSEVLELYQAIAFGLQNPDPELTEVIGGNVKSYNERTGAINVTWIDGENTGLDWDRQGRFDFLKAKATGPFSIVASGKSLSKAFSFLLSIDKDNYYVVNSGERDKYRLIVERKIDGEKETIRDRNDSPVDLREAYKFAVKVSKTSISVTYNGKKLGSIPKKKSHWGWIGVTHTGADKLTLKGRVDPSWVQNARSAWREKRKRTFNRAFKIEQVAPGWLLREPVVSASAPEDAVGLPWAVDEKNERTVSKLDGLLANRRSDLAVKLLVSTEGQKLDDVSRKWFEARIAHADQEYERALTLVEGLDQSQLIVRVLRARILVRSGRDTAAIALVEKILEDSPDRRDGFVSLAEDLLEGGRTEHANTVLERARGLGASGRHVDDLSKFLRFAADGPQWTRRYESKTRNYHVFSDIDRATCAEACEILEKAYSAFSAYVGEVEEGGRRRFRVYLFSGEAGYASYVRQLTGTVAAGSAGLYFPKLKQLLVWNTDAQQMLYTIRHEGFHQYFDRVCADDSPRWLNEGLAEYYERAQSGTWQKGTPRKDHLDTLEKGIVPLERFVKMKPAAFMSNARRHYAQSWALVRFLRHSTRENRLLFKSLVDELKVSPPDEAMNEVFADMDWVVLEKELRAHLEQLR